MHGQKVTLNRLKLIRINYHLTFFNFVQIYERIFICHNFPDTAVAEKCKSVFTIMSEYHLGKITSKETLRFELTTGKNNYI